MENATLEQSQETLDFIDDLLDLTDEQLAKIGGGQGAQLLG